MTALAIDFAIPLPKRGRKPSDELLAMRSLEVGQSFLVDDFRAANRIRFHQCKEPGRKFALRKVIGGWRCWRVE